MTPEGKPVDSFGGEVHVIKEAFQNDSPVLQKTRQVNTIKRID